MKVCVVTTTRAEYGLLYPLLSIIEKDRTFELEIIVSGTHLLEEYGYTKQEIYKDGFKCITEIDIMHVENRRVFDISEIMGLAILRFSNFLKNKTYDLAIVLGDRYEIMAFATVLANQKIPIAHLNGGEVTGGLLDEIYRHCITKMSTLHFTNCERHKKNVIQMGEDPNNVYNVGDICIDNIVNTDLYSIEKLENILNISLKDKAIIIVTFHPVTMEDNSIEQLKNMLEVIDSNDNYFYLFTAANSDNEGEKINRKIQEFVKSKSNMKFVLSLGRIGYLSMLNIAKCVMGNSSSGIYEVPYYRIPTINIGNRQKDRLHGDTVVDCDASKEAIADAFNYALSPEFVEKCILSNNIWGEGNTAEIIVDIIKSRVNSSLVISKSFNSI